MKKLIIASIILVSFFSCQKVLDLDAETKIPKLVVNSLFNDQDKWEVYVSRSLSVLDNGNLTKVDNATVSIYDGTTLVSNLTYDGEKYIILGLSSPPTAGKIYRIEVSAPNFTSVSSSDFCPQKVSILQVDTSSTTTSFGDREENVTIKFQDPGSTKNHYGIEFNIDRYSRYYNSTSSSWDTSYIGSEEIYIASSNPVVDNSGPDNYVRTLTLKDNLFDGQQKSILFNYYRYPSGNPNEFSVKTVKLFSLTEATYKYKKSITAYRAADGNPFAEPVQVFTNVENGFGIFGGQSNSEIKY